MTIPFKKKPTKTAICPNCDGEGCSECNGTGRLEIINEPTPKTH